MRALSFVYVLTVVVKSVGADDDLVKSTLEEAKLNEEEEHPEDIEARRPRTTASVHPLTDIPPPGDFAETRYHVISHSDLNWRAGDEVTVLCHFSHRLAKAVNLTGLMGSLNSPVHFGYYLQNFSYDNEFYQANAKEDVTLDYTFRIDDNLDPGKWQVALTVYYSVGPMLFASTFFNQTITLSAPASSFGLFSLFVFLSFTFAAAFFGKEYLQAAKSNEAAEAAAAVKARESAAAAADAAEDDESWTAHLTNDPPTKTKRASKKSVKSPRKK